MDFAAFQSIYPEEVRIQLERTSWTGQDLQFYNAESDSWNNMANGAQALMFPDNTMTFDMIDGLVKSSIVSGKQFAIIATEGNLVGFVRGHDLQTEEDEEMDVEIDWNSDSSVNTSDYEAPDMFSPEEELKRLL